MTKPLSTTRPVNAIVLDDDPLARRLATAMLRSLGVKPVIEASEGAEALKQLREHPETIDVALCDLEMEGMDGIEFLSQLHLEKSDITVILVSGAGRALLESVEHMAHNLGLRVLGSLTKPIDKNRLAGYLTRLNVAVAGTQSTHSFEGQISVEEIHDALGNMSFIPFFQPRILLANKHLIGCEALIRWRHPRLGILSPHRFLPLVKDAGQLSEMTWRMLDLTFRELVDWQKSGLDLSVSVNILPDFLQEIAVTENLIALARNYGIPFNRIVLEIAESAALTFDTGIIANLARLRLRGIHLAIDDFGTGYASMERLHRLPFTELSIDRSLVAGALTNTSMRAILESSLHLGRRLGLHTIAEGVETEEQFEMLCKMPCDSILGNFISPGIDAQAFIEWARVWSEAHHNAGAPNARVQPLASVLV